MRTKVGNSKDCIFLGELLTEQGNESSPLPLQMIALPQHGQMTAGERESVFVYFWCVCVFSACVSLWKQANERETRREDSQKENLLTCNGCVPSSSPPLLTQEMY